MLELGGFPMNRWSTVCPIHSIVDSPCTSALWSYVRATDKWIILPRFPGPRRAGGTGSLCHY
eukprot:3103185-Amphidinium_carterae.1